VSERQTDETGLCALDCGCARCEAGFRPTEEARAAARRALALERAARMRVDEGKRATAPAARAVPWWAKRVPSPAPYTEEQKAELARMRAAFAKGGKAS
jgi:hypothetical protein